METYASPQCRKAFEDLRDYIGSSTRDLIGEARVGQLRREKEAAIEARDYEAAARLRQAERQAAAEVTQTLGVETNELRAKATALIDAARDSLLG